MNDRLIKESDVLKAIDKRIKELSKHPEFVRKNGHIDVIGVKKHILAIPSADRPQGWTPCSERPPKRQGYYICTCKDGSKNKRTTAVKWSNGWQLTGARAYWKVLAWMPLPEPWEGADNE